MEDKRLSLQVQTATDYRQAQILPRAKDSDLITDSLTPLQELSQNIELCAKKQRRLHFIIKEVSEVLKR